MPFLYLDDNFADHPKVDGLSHGAFRLHVAALLYAARQLTDGKVPAEKVPRLMPGYRVRYLEELVERRLWLPDASTGYTIHDYLDWNKPRAEIEADRERLRKVRSEAGRKGAKARWHTP
jgi:hypothetical protein